ncbi:MAG: hypothetical protein PHW10_01775 [Candidatus Peribacteraceae bacterium]|nr:hypothetical protein [Candidatus Peribacteraceae bacterium]
MKRVNAHAGFQDASLGAPDSAAVTHEEHVEAVFQIVHQELRDLGFRDATKLEQEARGIMVVLQGFAGRGIQELRQRVRVAASKRLTTGGMPADMDW